MNLLPESFRSWRDARTLTMALSREVATAGAVGAGPTGELPCPREQLTAACRRGDGASRVVCVTYTWGDCQATLPGRHAASAQASRRERRSRTLNESRRPGLCGAVRGPRVPDDYVARSASHRGRAVARRLRPARRPGRRFRRRPVRRAYVRTMGGSGSAPRVESLPVSARAASGEQSPGPRRRTLASRATAETAPVRRVKSRLD